MKHATILHIAFFLSIPPAFVIAPWAQNAKPPAATPAPPQSSSQSRYGIRVGDRISVAGITGDVVDIGLVRMYVLELAGTGLDFYPTGRIVAFSNSVLFQAGTPLFRQIPGTEYTWHEVVVIVSANGNYKAVQEKLMA